MGLLFFRGQPVALGWVTASAYPSHVHSGPTWQIFSLEMQVLLTGKEWTARTRLTRLRQDPQRINASLREGAQHAS